MKLIKGLKEKAKDTSDMAHMEDDALKKANTFNIIIMAITALIFIFTYNWFTFILFTVVYIASMISFFRIRRELSNRKKLTFKELNL